MEEDDNTIYKVVVNHEEQYSIWPAHKTIPLGWRDAGKSGIKQDCLDHVKLVWTDMRPLSLRKKMEANASDTNLNAVSVDESNGAEAMSKPNLA